MIATPLTKGAYRVSQRGTPSVDVIARNGMDAILTAIRITPDPGPRSNVVLVDQWRARQEKIQHNTNTPFPLEIYR